MNRKMPVINGLSNPNNAIVMKISERRPLPTRKAVPKIARRDVLVTAFSISNLMKRRTANPVDKQERVKMFIPVKA
jgi:hypothetical protein